ncbi:MULTISPECIES: hypothetical protein [Vibrio]|uniref:hypothetical protein n=1 Tax=Vibrio TaxID=662 RepID=UPI000ABF7F67|nr:hypothetical protein [Vibrio parahaemolyticus]EGQ9239971.1 hypothetical protein [Vibrio vulnificus]EHD1697940.1 hypothetical protein [Vibrio vulnificus]EKZ9225740.1 hypothetical protein [Vibrio vulnificus]ELC9582585.1 hypothetical protein [Vibrio vulnificus]MCU8150255.1 hypothetical protein [Vibrio vulnificus]
MTNPLYYSDLLDSERIALRFVQRIGLERAKRVYLKVCTHMDRRAAKYNDKRTYYDYTYTAISVAHTRELLLCRSLKTGITLVDIGDTPFAARQRNLARMALRKNARIH